MPTPDEVRAYVRALQRDVQTIARDLDHAVHYLSRDGYQETIPDLLADLRLAVATIREDAAALVDAVADAVGERR